MTNHIEQLMKAAGVEPYKRPYFECKGGRSSICLCPQIGVPNAWCKEDCDGEEMQEKVEFFYPAFTPAKQLELIKLIGKKHRAITYIQGTDYYAMQVNPVSRAFGMYYEAESFEEVIVITILELLKVNELDKSEVKKILEV